MPDTDLTTCVSRAQRGESAAFERIVQLTARAVYAQIVAAVRDRQHAEDLTQETYVAAWRAIGSVEEAAGFMSWLLTLARNKVRDGMKHQARQKRGGSPPTESGERGAAAGTEGATSGQGDKGTRGGQAVEEVADAGAGPDRAAEAAEARERALALLAELPEEYRAALSMRYLGGADYETIRTALGMTDGALRGVLNRGMAILRERMDVNTKSVKN